MMNLDFPIRDAIWIQNRIPQRFPMVMVDGLLSFSATAVEASLTVTAQNIFAKDSLFQEVGLIEHMAQTVALHTGVDFFIKKQAAPTGYIGAINKISIYTLPKVSDQIRTKATILQEFMGVTLVEIQSYLGDTLIAEGQMKTVIAN